VRPFGRLAAAGVFALAMTLTGCSILGSSKPPAPCPKVFLIDDTSRLTAFRPGPGRDITDVDFQAEISGYTGSCTYDRDKMSVSLNAAFDVSRGPANATRKVAFQYFVAVPKVYPDPAGKRVFDVGFAFEANQSRARFGDEIEIDVPLKNPSEGPAYEIYLGFQLTAAELAYNRAHRAAGVRP
jgi:hypothetical protein